MQNILMTKKVFLNQLKIGQKARVIGMGCDSPVCHCLLEMGITPDEEIKIVRFAPMGDPIEIEIRGYRLSLRKQEAEMIQVQLL